MPLDRETISKLEHLANRVTDGSARGVVLLVDDTGKMQLLQIGVLDGETIPDAEHVQPYGFSSVPLVGADTVVAIFPGGDRGHPLVVSVGDRRYRPTGGEPGEVTIYNHTGAKAVITKDGDIKLRAAPGRHVLVDDGSGTTEPLVKRSEFLAHGHPIVASGAVTPCAGPVTGGLPNGSSVTFPGTGALQSK